jgi:LysM repeat protein
VGCFFFIIDSSRRGAVFWGGGAGGPRAARDSVTRRGAARDSTARPASTATRPRTHTVAEGETLYGIARRYSVTAAQLRVLNPGVGDELEVGTVLRLPAGARAPGSPPAPASTAARAPAAPAPATRTTPPAAARGRRTHVVAAHETLFGLARRYGVSVDALRAANHLEGDALRVGQTLVIPAPPRN